ncbi:putative Bis(5'-adenosyl)-triphosphatase [Trypanosoma vivax]|nr:putative Bis(5'-adenosyl)-triphosphatase [Trypanosoma vivax]
MRCAQLPPKLSITGGLRGHWVVAVSNNCEGFKKFCASVSESTQKNNSSVSPGYRARFRVDHLLPADWTALLRQCVRLVRQKSQGSHFNIFCPGDLYPIEPDAGSSTARTEHKLEVHNFSVVHVVERTRDDFVPNNLIYHEIQKRYSLPSHPFTAVSPIGVGLCNTLQEFSFLLRQLQELREDAETIVDNEDVVEDALAVLHAAVQASVENQRVFATNASSIGENMPSEASSEEIFTFFPHRVVVRDCIPYHSRYFVVMVNHKPIVPGHLMIVPIRCVGTIGALTTEELEDFGHVIHATINALRRFRAASSCLSYDCSDVGSGEFGSGKRSDGASSALSHDHIKDCGFSIAIQMGELAGQTVPHLHVHVIPFDADGRIAGEPEDEEVQRRRSPRTRAQMREETELLKVHFTALQGQV